MTAPRKLIAIVEGPGDKAAVPGLLRRILGERLNRYDITVAQAKALGGRSNLNKKLEMFLRYALVEECSAILVLVDADTECPTKLALSIVDRVTPLNLDVPVAVACAKHEYETWFICTLSENTGQIIRERLEISETVTAPENIEGIRDPKGWITNCMPANRAYRETVDQESLTHHIDFALAQRRSRSFRRLCHAVEELVFAMDNQLATVTPGPR